MSPNNIESDPLLAIAHLARPHGVHGEISAIPLVPPVVDPTPLIEGVALTLRDPKGKLRPITGETVRTHQERWLVKLDSIDDMTAADTLRGFDLCLARSMLPPLPDGWFYEADLEGCRVIDERLGEIGIVLELELGFAQPQLKIQTVKKTEVLIPWRDAFFPEVDIARKQIRSRLPEGMPGLDDKNSL